MSGRRRFKSGQRENFKKMTELNSQLRLSIAWHAKYGVQLPEPHGFNRGSGQEDNTVAAMGKL